MAETKQKSDDHDYVEFVSTDNNLRIVEEPQRNRMDSNTGALYVTEGKTHEFERGVLRVDKQDSDSLKFLRDHQLFGTGPEGLFVERGDEPDRPGDASADLERIVDLTVDDDADGLAELYLAERSGESRPEVLRAAARAIDKLEGELPPPPQTPVHQFERYRDPSVEATTVVGEGDPEADYPAEPKETAKPKSTSKK